MTRFPGAPKGAEYTDEGWLIWGDEAWTEHEWKLLRPLQRRAITGDVATEGETPDEELRRYHRERARIRRARAREEAR